MKKIRVCNSKACSSFGAKSVMEEITKNTGLKPGKTDEKYDLDYCGCTGYCSRSPNLVIDDKLYVFETSPKTVIEDIAEGGEDMTGKEIDLSEVDFLGDLTDKKD
jgi:NADH:ubiquinone oxidoreductase subunit E